MPRASRNEETNPPPAPPNERLSERQITAAILLVRGDSTNEIASRLRVNRHTVSRWKKSPLFQSQLRVLRERLTQRLLDGPQRASTAPPPPIARRPAVVERFVPLGENAEYQALLARVRAGMRADEQAARSASSSQVNR